MTTKPRRMNLGPDPLDPHGDGSIREGDPLYALLMSGEVIHAERATDDGDWDVTLPDGEAGASVKLTPPPPPPTCPTCGATVPDWELVLCGGTCGDCMRCHHGVYPANCQECTDDTYEALLAPLPWWRRAWARITGRR